MKLTIRQDALLKALSRVSKVVERRNTIPILANLLIEAREGKLFLTATDLDLEVRDEVETLSIENEGKLTAPADTLLALVRKLFKDRPIQLTATGDRLLIEQDQIHYELPTLPAEDFQSMATDESAVEFFVSAEDLSLLFGKTHFAISTEEARYYLNGIYLHPRHLDNEDLLYAVATDGHRLAISWIKAPSGSKEMAGVTIPRKTIGEIRHLLDDTTDAIEIGLSSSKLVLRIGRAVLISKLIEGGTFPDYERVIPKDNNRILQMDKDSFAASIERVSTLSMPVKLIAENNLLTITVNSAESGQGEEKISVEYEEEKLEIGFNSRYLLDIIAQIEGDKILIECSDSASPVLMMDPDETYARYVLMPLRV